MRGADTNAAETPPEWLTTEGLGRLLGTLDNDGHIAPIKVATIRGWRHKGTGPPWVRFGGLVRYSRAAVERWLADGGDRKGADAATARPARSRAPSR